MLSTIRACDTICATSENFWTKIRIEMLGAIVCQDDRGLPSSEFALLCEVRDPSISALTLSCVANTLLDCWSAADL